MARVINYNCEQEANKYLKKKTFDASSRYQSKTIPIPRYQMNNPSNNSSSSREIALTFDRDINMTSLNFMGRVMESLLYLTDSRKTVYSPEYSTWYQYTTTNDYSNQNMIIRGNQSKMITQEVCGLRLFSLLDRALGTVGMRGLDRLLGFRIVHQLNSFVKFFDQILKPGFHKILDEVCVLL
jgi:WASH complex subunit strumpellin